MAIFNSYVKLPEGISIHKNAINGKTHYFDWAMFNSKLLT